MKHLPLIFLAVSSISAFAGDSKQDLDEKANRASKILTAMAEEYEIPRALIEDADCVAAVTIHKGGIAGFGAKSGQGLVSCRTQGVWSNPSFINVNGASVGPQIGVGKVSMLMVFVGEKSVDQLKKLNVAGDAQVSIVAGPVGREAMAGVDYKLDNGIYSYAQAKGLYFGATIGGAVISPDKSSNKALYQNDQSYDPMMILETPASQELPKAFQKFLADLKKLS